MKIILHGTDSLGRSLSVETELSELDTSMRALSRIGFTSGELLGSGLTLPYDNEHDLDWSLIGGRAWTSPDNEVGVMWRGSFYKKRDYKGQDTGKKMPPAIKYSRGARPTDPDSIKEGDEAGIQYVTLITFKGGKRQDQWAAKSQQKVAPKQAPVLESEKPAPLTDVEPDFDTLSEEAVSKLQDHLRAKLPGTQWAELSFLAFANAVLTDTTVAKLGELTINQGRAVARAANQAKDAAA